MAAVGVRVEGLKELRQAIQGVADQDLKDAVKTANRAVADRVVAAALPKVPVRSGRLKRSVRAMASQATGRAVAGGAQAPYSGAIHWGRKRGNVGSPPGNRMGTNQIKGRPFLHDAAETVQRTATVEYQQALDAIFRRLFQ